MREKEDLFIDLTGIDASEIELVAQEAWRGPELAASSTGQDPEDDTQYYPPSCIRSPD